MRETKHAAAPLSPSSAAGTATSNAQYAEFANDLTAAVTNYITAGDAGSAKAVSALLTTYWQTLTFPAKAECLRLCVQSLPLHNALCRALTHSRGGQNTDLICQWLYELYQFKPPTDATAHGTGSAATTAPAPSATGNGGGGGGGSSSGTGSGGGSGAAAPTKPGANGVVSAATPSATATPSGVFYTDLQLFVLQLIPALLWSYLVRTGSNRTAPGIAAVVLGIYNHERLKTASQRAGSYGALMTNAALPSLSTPSVYHIPQTPFV